MPVLRVRVPDASWLEALADLPDVELVTWIEYVPTILTGPPSSDHRTT